MSNIPSKRIKKATILSIALSLLFVFAIISAMSIAVYANEETPTMTLQVSQENASAGETVQVKIYLINNPGVASLRLNVTYEDFLTLENIEYNSAMGGQATSSNYQQNGSPVDLIWVNAFENFTEDAVFATLTFRVADGTESGMVSQITVTYYEEDIYDMQENNIALTVVNGSVRVQCLPGDINGDGSTNNKDITRLFQHLANWDVSVNKLALDVNGDGKVNNKDITRLFQYLANWDVEIHITETFVVTFNGNGGRLVSGKETQVVIKGESAVAPTYKKEGYKLTRFDVDFSNVTSDITATAQWEEQTLHEHTESCYSDIWKFDGDFHWRELICDEEALPFNITIGGHTWNESYQCTVCGCVKKYTVSFVDFDGILLDEKSVEWGTRFENISGPISPNREGYVFVNWGETPETITEDLVLTAQYTKIAPLTITFVYTGSDNVETTLETTVEYGAMPTPPTANEMSAYKFVWDNYKALVFTGWDSPLEPATEDKTYNAVYDPDTKYENPIIALEYSETSKEMQVIFSNLSKLDENGKNIRELYIFSFEMNYSVDIEGTHFDINGIEPNTASHWFVKNEDGSSTNYSFEFNNKSSEARFAWSAPNIFKEQGEKVDEYIDCFTIAFKISANPDPSNIQISQDSCKMIVSDDGGEHMQVIQPIILYHYN